MTDSARGLVGGTDEREGKVLGHHRVPTLLRGVKSNLRCRLGSLVRESIVWPGWGR